MNINDILMAKKQGKNPKIILQSLIQQNPQVQQTMLQLQNMAGGRSPKEFLMQMARQNGADNFALQIINEIIN